jgi:hypothetical protein
VEAEPSGPVGEPLQPRAGDDVEVGRVGEVALLKGVEAETGSFHPFGLGGEAGRQCLRGGEVRLAGRLIHEQHPAGAQVEQVGDAREDRGQGGVEVRRAVQRGGDAVQDRQLPVLTRQGAARGTPGQRADRLVLWAQLSIDLGGGDGTLHILDGESRYLLRHAMDAPLQAVAVAAGRIYVLVSDPETELKTLRAYRIP